MKGTRRGALHCCNALWVNCLSAASLNYAFLWYSERKYFLNLLSFAIEV